MRKPESIVQADTEEGQFAGEALVEAIENQIRDGYPAETKRTLQRLMALGETRENAMRYIGCVLAVEVFEVLEKGSTFDEARYVRNLQALPELPYDEDDI
ncbi:MAG: hypothetical protein WD928_00570 [Gammaproteobacteria bacterium]